MKQDVEIPTIKEPIQQNNERRNRMKKSVDFPEEFYDQLWSKKEQDDCAAAAFEKFRPAIRERLNSLRRAGVPAAEATVLEEFEERLTYEWRKLLMEILLGREKYKGILEKLPDGSYRSLIYKGDSNGTGRRSDLSRRRYRTKRR
jgi:hypothetical protein